MATRAAGECLFTFLFPCLRAATKVYFALAATQLMQSLACHSEIGQLSAQLHGSANSDVHEHVSPIDCAMLLVSACSTTSFTTCCLPVGVLQRPVSVSDMLKNEIGVEASNLLCQLNGFGERCQRRLAYEIADDVDWQAGERGGFSACTAAGGARHNMLAVRPARKPDDPDAAKKMSQQVLHEFREEYVRVEGAADRADAVGAVNLFAVARAALGICNDPAHPLEPADLVVQLLVATAFGDDIATHFCDRRRRASRSSPSVGWLARKALLSTSGGDSAVEAMTVRQYVDNTNLLLHARHLLSMVHESGKLPTVQSATTRLEEEIARRVAAGGMQSTESTESTESTARWLRTASGAFALLLAHPTPEPAVDFCRRMRRAFTHRGERQALKGPSVGKRTLACAQASDEADDTDDSAVAHLPALG